MKINKLILTAFFGTMLFSCNDLNVPPLNKVTENDVFTSESGVTAYLARLYDQLPIQAFDNYLSTFQNLTGEAISRIDFPPSAGPYTGGYMNYSYIRDVNLFFRELAKVAGLYQPASINTWMGEAYFCRAYAYFAMARGYGGVPIVREVIEYTGQDVETLQQARDKEVDCYNFILEDLDKAIELLPATSPSDGRANRYVAYGMKARVALWAASIAKYGTVQLDGLCGVPSGEAKRFYRVAYDAAAKTAEGGYILYNDGSGDLATSYAKMFYDESSKENIWRKLYKYPEKGHSFDRDFIPYQMRGSEGFSSAGCPTLDFVEMFDDIEGNPFILNTGTDEAPVFYADRMELFAKAEPRLRGIVVFPGDVMKGEVIDVRKGIVKSGDPVSKFISTASFTDTYNEMPVQGASGIGFIEATGTGFYLRKWINPNIARAEIYTGKSVNAWIEMRYAEMLLTRAEAAVELRNLGDASEMDDAIACMQLIRDRAGAFKKYTTAATLTVEAVRMERRMELFYENQTFWDLRRWRVFDKEVVSREWKVLWPVYVWDEQKYYFKKTTHTKGKTNFDPKYYYLMIPPNIIEGNPLLEQNPGY